MTIADKLAACSPDELRVVSAVLDRLALGRERYGAWVADKEPRNFKRERTEEILDALVYGAMVDVVREGTTWSVYDDEGRICASGLSRCDAESMAETHDMYAQPDEP